MKLPKKVYLAAAVLLFAGGGATATILLQDKPKEVTLKQASNVPSTDNLPEAVDGHTEDTQSPAVSAAATQQTTDEPTPVETVQNPYAEGTSWAYVWDKRSAIGKPLPQNMGSSSWTTVAAHLGLTVSGDPVVGAVVDWGRGVAIVNSVNADGTITIQSSPSAEEVVHAARNYIH